MVKALRKIRFSTAARAAREAASDEATRWVALGMIPWDRPAVALRLARLHAATAASFRYFAQLQSATEIIRRADGLHDCWGRDAAARRTAPNRWGKFVSR